MEFYGYICDMCDIIIISCKEIIYTTGKTDYFELNCSRNSIYIYLAKSYSLSSIYITFAYFVGLMAQAGPPEDDEEELVFNVEEVQKIIRDNIELCLGGNTYSHSRCPQWITIITDKTLTRINKLNKPFKYIMRITITQKNGSGLHTAAAYYWDTVTDGACTVRWENKYMYCIVNIWALAIQL